MLTGVEEGEGGEGDEGDVDWLLEVPVEREEEILDILIHQGTLDVGLVELGSA